MRFAIVILCAVILLLVTAVLPVGKGLEATAAYTSPVMILLLGLLSAASVWCCVRLLGRVRLPGAPQRTARRAIPTYLIGFLLVHLGVVVILVGAFTGYVAGKKGMVQLQLFRPVAVSGLTGEQPVPFGFNVAAKDFEVEFYPPVYHLYRQISPDQIQSGQMPFEKAAEYDTTGKEFLEIDGIGRFEVSNLWNEGRQEWTQRRMLDAGMFLHLAGQTPSHYGVTLQIVDGEEQMELPVSINHPAGYKGWRFYLMSYDQMNRSYVVLSARHDPGRNAVIAGIWIVMIGTFILCFRRTGGAA